MKRGIDMKIAVDAMGGDFAPQAVIEGVLQARSEFKDLDFILYGDEAQIKPLLPDMAQLSIVHTTEKIAGDDEPVRAIRRKKQASMVLAAQAVKAGEADALFSLGNTGALLAAGLFIIGRVKGIDRPGLMPTLPSINSEDGFNMLDVGANAEAKPEHLHQYGLMGNFYAQDVRGIANPRIALLNNGTEASKGDELHKAAHQLLADDPDLNFIGNIEANDLLKGLADVVVTDGFTGNATLKAIEGTATIVMSQVKHAIMDAGVKEKIGGLLLKGSVGQIKTKFDTSIYGGAVLLGLKAPVIKAHGAADAQTVYYTVKQIHTMLANQTVQKVIDYFDQKKVSDETK
ncbi:plsX protein [Latilactobacillus fuchuensis DSM 14340 = JCM 11249]|uniref:Phosphate acyltransferase n=2 Tax=Latilactobacillus fuchuensis TaxID=164393 RepID=A0A0R1RWT6_9LACO|nr:plsX protein [Latilactobacillus fuchuensis DSM 14340 = JCM 11249]